MKEMINRYKDAFSIDIDLNLSNDGCDDDFLQSLTDNAIMNIFQDGSDIQHTDEQCINISFV